MDQSIYMYKKSQQKYPLYSCKVWKKKNCDYYLNLLNYLRHFLLLASNVKNQVTTLSSFPTFNFIIAKIWNNFCYVFVQMSGKYKKCLAHIGTPANVQNNYLNWSGSGFNKTIPEKG